MHLGRHHLQPNQTIGNASPAARTQYRIISSRENIEIPMKSSAAMITHGRSWIVTSRRICRGRVTSNVNQPQRIPVPRQLGQRLLCLVFSTMFTRRTTLHGQLRITYEIRRSLAHHRIKRVSRHQFVHLALGARIETSERNASLAAIEAYVTTSVLAFII